VKASPEALDLQRGLEHRIFVTTSFQISVALLQSHRGTMIHNSHHQPTDHHMENHDSQDERAMIMFGAVGQVEQLLGDGDVSTCPHTLSLKFSSKTFFACQYGIDDLVLISHQVADLLDNAEQRTAVEMR
jgi:hypothetical protein